MPSNKRSRPIRDIWVDLGLRAGALTSRASCRLNPTAEEFVIQVRDLCKKYRKEESKSDIERSQPLKDSVWTLLANYAPSLWPSVPDRPWLFEVGEVYQGAIHRKDLYYDNPEHRKVLKELVHELACVRAVRYRKDYRNMETFGRDSSYTPSDHSEHMDSEIGTTLSRSIASCFAISNQTLSVNAITEFTSTDYLENEHQSTRLDPHQDAAKLKELGVWLGDYNEPAAKVNGCSFQALQRIHFEEINVAAEPLRNERSQTNDVPVGLTECAACHYGPLRTEKMTVRCNGHERRIRIYPCQYRNKKLFAILKGPKTYQDPYRSPVYSFWRVEGEYTTDVGLSTYRYWTARTTQSVQLQSLVKQRVSHHPPPRPRCQDVWDDKEGSSHDEVEEHNELSGPPIKQRDSDAQTKESIQCTDTNDQEGIRYETSADPEPYNYSDAMLESDCDLTGDGMPLEPSRTSGDGDSNRVDLHNRGVVNPRKRVFSEGSEIFLATQRKKLSSGCGRTKSAQLHPESSKVGTSPGLGVSPDERIMSGTPRASQNSTTDRTARRSELPFTKILNAAARSATTAISGSYILKRAQGQGEPQQSRTSYRIDLRLKIRGETARNVVVVNSAMQVQQLFSVISDKLQRKRGGREMVALRAYLDQDCRDEDALDIERNDHDAWHAVVEHWAKTGGLREQYGFVEVD